MQALKTPRDPCSGPVLTPARSEQLCPTPTPHQADTCGPSGHGPLGHRQGGCPGKCYLSLRGLPRTDVPLRAPTTSCDQGTRTRPLSQFRKPEIQNQDVTHAPCQRLQDRILLHLFQLQVVPSAPWPWLNDSNFCLLPLMATSSSLCVFSSSSSLDTCHLDLRTN